MAYPRKTGAQIRQWRMEHDLLLIQMAIGMGVKTSRLSGWETGRIPWMPAQKRKAIVWMDKQRKPRRSLRDLMRIKKLEQLARQPRSLYT
ncbi:MAG: helix-turn-helix transcriptional regulator [Pseudomonadota bacterium]